jgi:hypothetical protein
MRGDKTEIHAHINQNAYVRGQKRRVILEIHTNIDSPYTQIPPFRVVV